MIHYYKANVYVTTSKATELEMITSDGDNAVWKGERQKRITSSSFGQIVKRRSKAKVEKLVKHLLYGTFGGNGADKMKSST